MDDASGAWDTYHCTFRWRIAPRLVITREHAQVASSHELFVIQSQYRVIRVQEVRVEDNLHSVVVSVEQLDATDLVQDRIMRIVGHIMRRDWWQRVTLESEDSPF